MRVRQMDESQRGHGFTTLQMTHAPLEAVYVWPDRSSLSYAINLARQCGRGDLEIVGPDILERRGERLRGRLLSAIVLDHGCEPTSEEYDILRELRAHCIGK